MVLTMLMDFLHFTFDGFWHFVGVWMLIAIFFAGIAKVVGALRSTPVPGPAGPPCPEGPMGIQGRNGADGVCNCNGLKH